MANFTLTELEYNIIGNNYATYFPPGSLAPSDNDLARAAAVELIKKMSGYE